MRILVCECKQEVSSFNPALGRYDDFVIKGGDEFLSYHRPLRLEVGGALSVFDSNPELTVVPGYSARPITSSGTLADADFLRIITEFLESVRAAQSLDGVYFALHGALAAESEFDVEGYLLAETRKILGEEIPIVVSLDLHGVLTDRMLEHCDAATVYQTYPHVDFFQTGERAARLLLRILAAEVHPVMVRVPVPALVRGNELVTETGIFGRIIRKVQEVENGCKGLSAGMFIGNPFTDTPDLCSNAFVVTDGDEGLCTSQAIDLAQSLWSERDKLQATLTGLEEAVRLTKESTGRVVLVDAADATSSGASGDSNAILRALVEAKCLRSTLVPLVDSSAVDIAFRAGVGSTIELEVGGHIDPVRFTALPVKVNVAMLSDGQFRSESHGDIWNGGKTAVLKMGNYTLVVTSRAVNLYDRSLFLAHGQDPAQFDVVVVKSPHCQHRFFDEGAEHVINVDAPGSSSANLKSLGHQHCRPIFPLDNDIIWTPQPRIFRRQLTARSKHC
jgi:microcystin degradation protein MlrC